MRFVHVSSVLAPLGASLVALAIAGCGDKAPQERLAPPGPPPTPTLEQVKAATISGVFEQAITLAEKNPSPLREPSLRCPCSGSTGIATFNPNPPCSQAARNAVKSAAGHPIR